MQQGWDPSDLSPHAGWEQHLCALWFRKAEPEGCSGDGAEPDSSPRLAAYSWELSSTALTTSLSPRHASKGTALQPAGTLLAPSFPSPWQWKNIHN